MPISTRCPSCDRKLRVPDNLLGTRVKCPGCQTVFTAEDQGEEAPPPAPAAPAPRERPPERPREPVTDRPAEARRRPAPPPPPEEEGAGGYQEGPEGDYEEDRPRERGGRSREMALSAVAGPAIALIVVGIIHVALSVLAAIGYLILGGMQMAGPNPGRPGANVGGAMVGTTVNVAGCLVGAATGAVVLYGGLQMKNLKSRGWAMAGSIVALVPCLTCCLVGIPIGIWSLMALNKPEVVNAFG